MDVHRQLASRLLIVIVVMTCAACASSATTRMLGSDHARICQLERAPIVLTREDLIKRFPDVRSTMVVSHDLVVCGHYHNKGPVLLLHELPGLSDKTLDYATTLADDFMVYVPLLFGDLYQDNGAAGTTSYFLNGEWDEREDLDHSTLITEWLHKVVAEIENRHSGQTIGVIGNCMTGTLPLALLQNPQVNAVVLAQPTLPIPGSYIGAADDLAISDDEWCVARQRLNPTKEAPCRDGAALPPARAYGVRFENDCIAKREKYVRLQTALGDGFIGREIKCADYVVRDADDAPICEIEERAHSVLIAEWMRDKHSAGLLQPSQVRREEVLRFLKDPFGFKEPMADVQEACELRASDTLAVCPKDAD